MIFQSQIPKKKKILLEKLKLKNRSSDEAGNNTHRGRFIYLLFFVVEAEV